MATPDEAFFLNKSNDHTLSSQTVEKLSCAADKKLWKKLSVYSVNGDSLAFSQTTSLTKFAPLTLST